MKKFLKLTLILALIALTVFATVSCQKTKLPDKQVLDNVFKVETFSLPEGMEYITSFEKTSDGYLVYGTVFDEENDIYSEKFVRLDENFNKASDFYSANLELDENSWMGQTELLDDGTYYTTISSYYYDEATGYGESKNYIVHLDNDFNIIKQLSLTDLMGLKPEEHAYASQMTALPGGKLAFICNDNICVLDNDMNIVLKKSTEDLGANYISTLLVAGDELIAFYSDSSYNQIAVKLDVVTGAVSEPYDLSEYTYSGQCFAGTGEYDLYYITDKGVGGYSFETGTGELVLDYMNSDLMQFYPNSIIPLDDGRFVCATYDYTTSQDTGMKIMRLTPVPEDEIKPKYILTLGALYMDYNIQKQVYDFNRNNDEYRIVFKNYSEGIDYSEDSEYTYEDAIAKLNGDIAAGNIPDLLVCTSEIPFDSYSSKGMFADLYKYIDEDENFDRSMFEANVLAAYEKDGKLYRFSPQFTIQGFMAKEDVIGEYAKNWNTESFLKLANSLPEGTTMFLDMTRASFMEMVMSAMYDEFVDIDTNKCYFNDGTFEKLLEFAKTLSETSIYDNIDYGNVDDSFWQDIETAPRDGRVVLVQNYLSNFSEATSPMEYAFSTDEVVFLGYPTKSGHPVIVDNSASISMSSKSKLKDGAWAFIASLLTPEYQENLDWCFPVRTDSLIKLMEKQIADDQKRKEDAENNEKEDIMLDGGFVGGMARKVVADMAIRPFEYKEYYLDNELAQEVLAYIRTADMLTRNDSEIEKIVNEEAGRFFEGQCTSAEAANAIQSRAAIYVSENN